MEFFITELTLPLLKEKFKSLNASLSWLKVAENVDLQKFIDVFEQSKSYSKTFVVIEQSSWNIVGCVRGLLDYKYIRWGSIGGRVEEITFHPDYQWKWLGSKLMAHVLEYLKAEGCYKIELACEEKLVSFYEKFWFQGMDVEMKMYVS